MKKKLIAIVASLAMVATMVPATAFAAEVEPVNNLGAIEMMLPTAGNATSGYDINYGTGGADETWYNEYKTRDNTATEEAINANVKATFANDTLTLTGTVPYTKNFTNNTLKFSGDLANGNYVALKYRAGQPAESYVAGWAISYSSRGYGGGDSTTSEIVHTYKYADIAGEAATNTAAPTTTSDVLVQRISTSKPDIKLTITYLTVDGVKAFAAQKIYTEQADKNTLRANMQDKNYVAGSKTITVKTSGLTLLTDAQTNAAVKDKEAVDDFVDAVADIGTGGNNTAKLNSIDDTNTVNTTYRRNTISARNAYDSLTPAQKKVVDDAVASSDASDNKTAYQKLLVAEKNVASYDQVPTIAPKVAALPAASTVDLTNEETVNQIKAVMKEVEALTPGVKTNTLLVESGNAYLNPTEVINYNTLAERINNIEAQVVIDAINALPTIPNAFTNQESVDTVKAPLDAVNKAFDDLTTAQQDKVSNRGALTTYDTTYKTRLKTYVDGIYADAAKIDLDAELSEDSIALITELQTYVEKRYITSPADLSNGIEGFEWDVYDALVAALDQTEKDGSSLENATIAAIADQTYTGEKLTPSVTVTIGEKEVPADAYNVIYSDNRDAGEATVTVVAKNDSTYTGSTSATFTITPAALTDAMVRNIANVTYTGRAITPAISAASGVTYEVAYRNNTAVGKATATITGTGNYTGTITKNFIVKPAKEAISSLKAGKKSLTVAYKAQTGAKYRIVYSPAKGQAKAVNTTATKKTIKNLKAGKTYKVKVRAYKAIDGTTYNGTYSTVKKVKVK